jgi:2-polyprenyl-3-methyl-5-hydroxy-6-metoxy-1,4-benzoquinol methylase
MDAPVVNLSVPLPNCPLCGCGRLRMFARHCHSGIALQYVICKHCSLVFLSPRVSEGELARFYAAEYRRLSSGQEEPTDENVREQRLRADHLKSIITSHIGSLTSHLDIGSSTGELLLAVMSFYSRVPGYFCAGIEPSDAHRSWSRERGLAVYASVQELGRAIQARFELVTLVHVLEHLPDPIGFLRTVRDRLIDETGHLLIEVPNVFGHPSFEIAHLFAFSEKTLKDVLRVAGFRILVRKLHSVPRQTTRGYRYITVLCAPSPAAQGAKLEIEPVWWRTATWRRLQWSIGLGQTWADLVRRVPRRAVPFLVRRLRSLTGNALRAVTGR